MNRKRVCSLLRVSSRQQLHDDDIPVQRAEIANYIRERPDWEFAGEYMEKAVSAFKNNVEDREVLLQILEDAKAHRFDILLTFMSDRIGRKEEYNMYIATLNRLGIEVWTIKEGLLSTRDETDRLTLYLKFWSNERESRKTGERVKAAQCEMVKQGRHVGGYAPYGYELVYSGEISNHGRALKRLRIKEEEARVIREIFRLSAEENLGSYAIARRLNRQGIPSVNGREWKSCTVSDRLKNPVYMGYPAYNRRTRTDACRRNPPEEWVCSEQAQPGLQIVSPELWRRSQRCRELRKAGGNRDKDGGATTAGRLPLMGLAYCACCGSRLTNGSRYDAWTLKNGTRVRKICRRYKCTRKANAGLTCSGPACYGAEEIEEAVFAEVRNYLHCLKTGNIRTEIAREREQTRRAALRESESLRRELQSIRADIRTLENHIPQALAGTGPFGAERLSSLLREKEMQEKEAVRRLRSTQHSCASSPAVPADKAELMQAEIDWAQEFQLADTHLKKLILFKIIERIEVGSDQITIVFKLQEEAFTRSHGLPEKSGGR